MTRHPWTKKQKILGVIAILVAGGVLSAGGYYTWLITPPGIPQTAEAALQTIGSKRFQRMPKYRKEAYLDHANRLMRQVPDEQRAQLFTRMRTDDSVRQAMGQVRQHAMLQQAIAFANATGAERIRLLDEAVDRMEARRARRRNRQRGERQGGPKASGERRRHSDARFQRHLQTRFEHGNPQTNGLIGEYFRALRKRREEREKG